MAREVEWTQMAIEEFVHLAALTKEEEAVLRLRVSGCSIVEQSLSLHMSTSKVSAITARLKDKYDRVQPFATFLQPRVKKTRKNPKLTR